MESKHKASNENSSKVSPKQAFPSGAPKLTSRHLHWGWWGLLFFLSMGIVLEALHGFKVGAYLDVGNETRRLMWTLAHAHGTLLSLIHVAFALSLPHLSRSAQQKAQRMSGSLIGASILMPGGFFLGGWVTYGGDPGVGIFLLPIGAFLLFMSVFGVASGLASASH